MSNVIQFLERLGQDASIMHSSGGALDLAAMHAEIAPDLLEALKAGDQTRLLGILGAQSNICCMILPAKQDEDEDEDVPQQDDDEDSSAKSHLRGARKAIASA